jgi:imidazolonepropionase-like amidohydrolase
MLRTALALACVLNITTAHAENAVLHVGHLLSDANADWQKAVTVVIKDGLIASIEPGYQAHRDLQKQGVPVIDWKALYVMPGMIDCHVHLTSDKAGIEGAMARFTDGIAVQAYEAQVNAGKTVRAGFTTVRNLGDADGVTLALRDAIRDGKVLGPRIMDAGTSISATTGHMDPTLGFRDDLRATLNDAGNLCNGVESCREVVRLQISRGADVIKFASTGGVNSRIGLGLGAQMFDDEAKTIIDTAHLYGKKVAVHAHGADGINIALKYGADSIEHGTLLDDEGIALFKQSKAYYVPTLSTINGYIERLSANPNAYPKAVKAKIEWRIGITGKSLEKAHKAGIKIAFGTDAGVSMHGRNADEFELMVKFGMSPREAFAAATLNAADLLGLGADVGSLEAGKTADLIALESDPLKDVRVFKRMQGVIKSGKLVDMSP